MNNVSGNFIAGWKTPADWLALRVRLLNDPAGPWDEAFTEFFKARLDLRYLQPIKVLQENGTFSGEGFSIVAIQCSLIEFLESTTQGTNYRYLRRGEMLAPFEYTSSQEVFVSFLRDRAPFKLVFDEKSAIDFYVNVRCAMLHEARTKNGWRIWAKGPDSFVANVAERVVFRDNFQGALLDYIEEYGNRLPHEIELQRAFVRKFDNLSS
jgi:hypothetical protein